MTQRLNYSREEAMQILNNTSYTDDEKRTLYDNYMNELKKNRKNKIVEKLNEYAKNIPVITKEIYIQKLKEYENDDLSKPFEVIEVELANFGKEMTDRYNAYLENEKNKQVEEVKEEPKVEVKEEKEENDFEDTIFSEDLKEEVEDVKPSLLITDEISVLNEGTAEFSTPLFDGGKEEAKEVLPDLNEKEKGNASAIILSIIAVIIGVVVMYSIIRLN